MEGAFITLEGTDSSALAAQLKLLADDLTSRGHTVEILELPRSGEPSSYFAAQYLQGYYGPAERINAYSSSMFYALDHHEAAGQIRSALSRGKVVIASRYAGAVMAEQGAKFSNAEQRKGFYLWLENLEYVLLGTPRPNLSIILRTPAIGDGSNIAEVYDDIAQTFPKDYWQLHTVPVGKQLSGEQINKLINDRIKQFLPEIAGPPAPASLVPSEAAGRHELKLTLSILAKLRLTGVLDIRDLPSGADTDAYYVPSVIDEDAQREFTAGIDKLQQHHRDLRARLVEFFAGKDNDNPDKLATAILQGLVPIAQLSDVIVSGTDDEISRAIAALREEGTSESESIAQQLMEVIGVELRPAQAGKDWVSSLAEKIGHKTHGESSLGGAASLVDYSPRNELSLVTDIFFGHSNPPVADLRKMTENWPYDQKQEVLTAYLDRVRQTGQDTGGILGRARYVFEVESSIAGLHDLHRLLPAAPAVWQEFTPRHGFDVPEIIEEAGLTEAYEDCFDLSLRLHSILQSASDSRNAQYGVLLGHKARAVIALQGDDILRLQAIDATHLESAASTGLIRQLQQKVAEVHPLIAGSR